MVTVSGPWWQIERSQNLKFWNIKGLNHPGRNLCLGQLIRDYRVDFVGVQETKKESFHPSLLKNLIAPAAFS
jgi:hypothetical protein